MDTKDYSASAMMAAVDIAGILHVATIQIVIDGNIFNHYQSFKLDQSITTHHTFTLVLHTDVLGQEEDHSLEKAREFLGRRLSATFTYRNFNVHNTPDREFIGVITGVAFSGSQGNKSSIVLTGESPTALLNGAPHTQSFGGEEPESLASIAQRMMVQCLGEYRFDMRVKPTFTGNLSYSCQYNETHYNYLCRMAAAYGEWFFYDGRVLHFGKPTKADKPITLIYGKDTTEVELKMNALHTGTTYYGYNSSDNKLLTTGDAEPEEWLNEAGKYAQKAGRFVFVSPSRNVAPIRAQTTMDIGRTQQAASGAKAAEAFTLTGTTTVPFLYPGCLIEMNFRKPQSSDVKYYSRLLVTNINHQLDAIGNYKGVFTAIPADTEYLPAPAFIMPHAEPQMAKVISNADAQGRVMVQFEWQRGQDTTDFIRVATPDAGSSSAVPNNRGFVFIPEKNDQVMVNFIHGHPDRPFVQSALFHGGNGKGGFEGNHKKSITTRSGSTISFDDTEGKGSITVKDASGNEIILDGKGNINITASTDDVTVNAPQTMTFNARNLIINVQENISVSAGMNISTMAGMDIMESAGDNMNHFAVNDLKTVATNITHIASENVEHHAKRIEKTAEEMKVESTKDNMIINSADTVELRSAKKTKLF